MPPQVWISVGKSMGTVTKLGIDKSIGTVTKNPKGKKLMTKAVRQPNRDTVHTKSMQTSTGTSGHQVRTSA